MQARDFAIAVYASLTLISLPGKADAQPAGAFYVSDVGDDHSDGRSLKTAFLTLERARQAAREAGAPRTIYISGTFTLAAPFDVGRQDSGTHWQALPGSIASFQAANGADSGFYIHGSDGTSVSGLQFRGFKSSGIVVISSKQVTINDNVIRETLSTGWSQGAIHLTGSVPDATVAGNTIDGADYDGILVDTSNTSDVSRLTISDNVVLHTCRKIHDCGAIHINDRGRNSSGSRIIGNTIRDFGPPAIGGRGIYLDDWASGVIVANNSVAGPGRFAIQLHGGARNLVRSNRIDLRAIQDSILYQPIGDEPDQMKSNRFENNQFVVEDSRARSSIFPANRNPKSHAPEWTGNRLCVSRQSKRGVDATSASCNVLDAPVH